MESLPLWLQPAVLLTAFIFFWREAKIGRKELKVDMERMESHLREDMGNLETRITGGLDKLDSRVARIENIMLEQRRSRNPD